MRLTCILLALLIVIILHGSLVTTGDSGAPVYHCYYNICDEALIIGIIASGTCINNTYCYTFIINAYMIYYLFNLSPYPG